MDADRVEILHGADRQLVAVRIADDLKLDLLPAGNAALHQNLMNRGKTQAILRNTLEFRRCFCNAAAGAAERKGRPDNDRIPDLRRDLPRRFDILCNIRGNAGLPDAVHCLLEQLAVLGLRDCFRICTEQPDAVRGKESALCKRRAEIQAGLSAEAGKDAVRLFLETDPLQDLGRQRLHVDFIGHGAVGHDRRRIGVDQHDLDAVLAECAAGLRAGIIEFCRLSDDDRAGADHKNLMNIAIQRHFSHPPFSAQIHRRDIPYPAAPRRPPDGTAPRPPEYSGSEVPRRYDH